MVYIGFVVSVGAHSNYQSEGLFTMTYLEVVFRCGDAPGEREMQAIDSVREVYGVQRVKFNHKERTVRVTYDASRLKQDAVAKLLRQAGVDIREPLVLA
jgi:copper chaperone CopZ